MFLFKKANKFDLLTEFENVIAGGAELKRVALPKALQFLFCYQLTQYFNNQRTIAGLGSDVDQKLALIKCLVEFYERKAFFEIGIKKGFFSTNGIAGHIFEQEAKRSA